MLALKLINFAQVKNIIFVRCTIGIKVISYRYLGRRLGGPRQASIHEDDWTWKSFLRHWPFVRGTWWRHQMEKFSALLTICAGNSPVPGEFPTQMPVTRSFDVFFDLRPNKQLSKQLWGWWFGTPSWSLWRHCNDTSVTAGFPSQRPVILNAFPWGPHEAATTQKTHTFIDDKNGHFAFFFSNKKNPWCWVKER